MVSKDELQLLTLQKQLCGSWPQGRPGLLSEQTQQGIHKSGQARGNGFIGGFKQRQLQSYAQQPVLLHHSGLAVADANWE